MTRQEVVDAVKAAVRATGVQAYEWLAGTLDPDALPAVVVRDTDDELTNELYHEMHHLTIEAACFTSSGANTISDCRSLMGTIAQAIGNAVSGARLTQTRLAVEQDEHAVAIGTLVFTVPFDSAKHEV